MLEIYGEWNWKKGFAELDEKNKSKNKNGNRKMNWKDLNLFAYSLKTLEWWF